MSADRTNGANGLTRMRENYSGSVLIRTFEVDNAFAANYPDKAGRQHSVRMSHRFREHCSINRQTWG